jgi:uncharacterized membrane protein (Fun14 family)
MDHHILGHLPDQGPSPPIAQAATVNCETLMINGNRRNWSSIMSLIAKALNTINKVFLFLFLIHLQTFINLFWLCHYRVVCVDEDLFYLIYVRIWL